MKKSESYPGLSVPSTQGKTRIASIDLVRGIVILLMLLDHVRFFFYEGKGGLREPDLLSCVEYLTLWLPRFCAPVFFLLAGVSVAIQRFRGKDLQILRTDLIIRGLILVLLEVCVVRFAWVGFSPSEHLLQVLWCLGISMVLLTVFLAASRWVIGLVAVAVVVASPYLATLAQGPPIVGDWWAVVLFQPGTVDSGTLGTVEVVYPVFGWFGVMLGGLAIGNLYQLEELSRRKWLRILGFMLVLGFATSAFIGCVAGGAGSPGLHMASLLAPEKFPPSLEYFLLTVGVALLLLSFCPDDPGKYFAWLLSIGQVALFVYVIHLLVIKAACIGLLLLGRRIDGIAKQTDHLIWIYCAWLILALVLYPVAVWFKGVKHRSNSRWLHYF